MNLKKNFTHLINFEYILSKNILFLFLLLFQLLVFFYLRQLNWLGSPYLQERDAYSFYVYNFSSIENFLSQYRSFGGPIFVQIYKLISPTLNHWGIVNYIIYSISLNLLFFSLCSYNFNPLYSFFFVIGILGSTKIWSHFSYWSESLSISLIILAFSFYLLSSVYKKLYLSILFSFFLFYSYQTRPLLVVFVGFFIIFDLIILKFEKSKKIISSESLRIFLLTLLPLILFLFLRFIITGHIGIAPYVGAHLSAHTFFHLEKNKVEEIYPETKKFAIGMIKRRSKHEVPCNLTYSELKVQNLKDENYQLCYTLNTMSLILEMIKQNKNLEPFQENDPRNYNTWEHVLTLDKFFMSIDNHNEIDEKLKKFAYEQLNNNSKDYIEQSMINFFQGYKNTFYLNSKLIFLYLLSLILLTIIFFFSKYKITIHYNNVKIYALILAVLITNFFSIFFLSTIHMPKERLLAIQGIFVVPSLASYLIILCQKKISLISRI